MEKNKSLEADIENMEPQTDKVESPTKKLKTNPIDKSDESKTDDKALAADLKKRLEVLQSLLFNSFYYGLIDT